VELHGGRIWVESEPGKGLDVPLLHSAAGGTGTIGMSDRTILYVEDNEFNRKIVRDLLARTTYRLVEAIDGEMGVATARQELPDLIIMDIQLPKLPGLDTTRALRADPRTADIPIIVITSFALSGDEQQAREAGASAYLAKPYSPRELLQTIRKLAPQG
jgi:two-component system cell cycle response regulator DivK